MDGSAKLDEHDIQRAQMQHDAKMDHMGHQQKQDQLEGQQEVALKALSQKVSGASTSADQSSAQ